MLLFDTPEGRIEVALDTLIVAGWTGRDAAAVAHHVEELAAIGVLRPSGVPLFYCVSASLALQAARIDVLGPDTSGEVEPLLLRARGRLWLGIASDHTDRALETQSVAQAKQACPKVLGRELWPFDEVEARLDSLMLATSIDGDTPYQWGTLAQILPLPDLLRQHPLEDRTAMLCGTLPAIGGVRSAASYRMELGDPDAGRSMSLDYGTRILPIVA